MYSGVCTANVHYIPTCEWPFIKQLGLNKFKILTDIIS